jgi:hypothetical protein
MACAVIMLRNSPCMSCFKVKIMKKLVGATTGLEQPNMKNIRNK